MLLNGRYQFVRECLERGDVHVENVRTDEQVVDIFTRAQSRELLKKFSARLVVTRLSL